MPSPREVLREAGIGLETGSGQAGLLGECARLASVLRGRHVRALGLLPAGDDVAVPPAALAIGRALALASPRPVGVVDVLGSWPCARDLVGGAEPDGRLLASSWVDERLVVLTPRVAPPVTPLAVVRAALAPGEPPLEHLIADLTGLDHLGDHLAAFGLLDAVALVARRGRTTTRQVRHGLRDVPGDRDLGVLLTGV